MIYKNPNSVLVVIYAQNSGRVLMLQRQDDSEFWQSVTGSLEPNERLLIVMSRYFLKFFHNFGINTRLM